MMDPWLIKYCEQPVALRNRRATLEVWPFNVTAPWRCPEPAHGTRAPRMPL